MTIAKKIIKIILWIILIFIAFYSTIIIFQKIVWKDKTPNFFGIKNFIVLTGSMEPTFKIGDVVFAKETKDIKEDDIISFRIDNSVITHRVIEVKKEDDKSYYITKGDANSSSDTELIDINDVEGKYIFKIPMLGTLMLFLQKPIGVILVFGILISILILKSLKTNKKEEI